MFTQFKAYLALVQYLAKRLYRQIPSILAELLNFMLFTYILGVSVGNIVGMGNNGLGSLFSKGFAGAVILQGIVSGSLGDGTFIIFLAKWSRSIIHLLTTPIKDVYILLAIYTAVFIRIFTTLIATLIISYFMTGLIILHPLSLLYLICLITIIATSIGLVDGIKATSFQTAGLITRLVFATLWYCSGSLFDLGNKSIWLTYFIKLNPIYYIGNMFRYYCIGTSKFVPSAISLTMLTCAAALSFFVALRVFTTNTNIRN